MDVKEKEGKLSKLDQKKLQQDIKTLTKKATGLLQSMNDRLKDLRDKNTKLALEQQYIAVQPAWVPVEANGAAGPRDDGAAAAAAGSSSAGAGMELACTGGGVGPVLVERDAALMSPYIQKEVVQNSLGLPGKQPVPLPKQVTADSWAMVLEYCRFHLVPGRSDKERRMFDERFIKVDTNLLCELTSAADALDMRPLVDLASRAIARMIEGKSPDQIREAFRLPDDLTEEEKLEPLRTVADDPRIRMLNRLYAKKRKELQERKAQLLQAQQQAQAWQAQAGGGGRSEGAAEAALALALPTPVAAAAAAAQQAQRAQRDTRSLDELLSFIEDDGAGAKAAKAGSKSKGKKKKAKHRAGAGGSDEAPAEAPSPRPGRALEGGAVGGGMPSSGAATAASLPPRPPPAPCSAAAAAGAAGAAPAVGVGAAAAAAAGAAASPASTLSAVSLPSLTTTVSSGRSSLDSSPERLSEHSMQSTPGSPPGSPAGSGSGHPAAIADGGPALALHGALPRPPFRVPGLGAPAPWLEEDDIMDDYEYDSLATVPVPANPFAARTTLLHRPITTLTSLSAFRASPRSAGSLDGIPAPSHASSLAPPASLERSSAAMGVSPATDASQGGADAQVTAAVAATGAGAAPHSCSPTRQQPAPLRGGEQADALWEPLTPAAPAGAGAREAANSSSEEGTAAAAAALAALFSSFLEDLGLENHLRIVPGPAAAAAGGAGQLGSAAGGPACAAGTAARSARLPGGGLVELRWQRA